VPSNEDRFRRFQNASARSDDEPAEGEAASIIEQLQEDGADHVQYVLRKQAKERLDRFLQNRLKGMSRNQVHKLISLGGVTVNGNPVKRSQTLHAGDVLDVIVPPRPATELTPEPMPLEILYEDQALVAVNKPAGIIVHPARSNLTGTLLNGLAHHFQQTGEAEHGAPAEATLSTVGGDAARPGVVHRLDKNTTGVIVVAKQDEPHWLLARQFEHRKPMKAYLALVHGCPDPPGGAIEQPIGKHPTIRECYAVRHDTKGKHALTLYRVRERYQGYSLVELELKTGRTHQIRVHLTYMGTPIVGDVMYGGEPVGPPELAAPPFPAGGRPFLNFGREKHEAERIETRIAERGDVRMPHPALHAAYLSLEHPLTNQPITFTAPLHEPMASLVRRLRQQPAEGPVVTEGHHIDLSKAIPAAEEPRT
jgi:23S rRNA pseudouridine1911/1915/1917 synthase